MDKLKPWRLSLQAEKSLDDIFCWIAEQNYRPASAQKMIGQLHDGFKELSRRPNAGHKREELPKDVLCYVVRPYLILYSVSEEHIDVLDILHGARDLRKLFLKSFLS